MNKILHDDISDEDSDIEPEPDLRAIADAKIKNVLNNVEVFRF
jgi:hypothetical protein